MRESFLTCYLEAFRRGTWGVARDLRLLTRPWGFDLGSITAPTSIHHGDADTTCSGPARTLSLPRRFQARGFQIYPGEGHFSILGRPRDILAALAG